MNRIARLALPLGLVGLVAVVAGYAVFRRNGGVDGLMQSAVQRAIAQTRNDLFEDGNVHVFTLGTGAPQTGTHRMPAANAVIVNDAFIVVDAGEGASRTIGDLNIPLGRLQTILITHFHSDHIAGLGQLLNQSWNAGRQHTVHIYGPSGIEDIMTGLKHIYKWDIEYRTATVVEHNDPARALGIVHTFHFREEENSVPVLEEDGVTVTAFRVDHGHVEPACGYRVEYQNRSVVFSGDTKVSDLVVDAAQGADLLIHEAINYRMMDNAASVLEQSGMTAEADRARAVKFYHADTLALAEIAQRAEVGKLVLTHLIPGPPNRIVKRLFTLGMKEHFSGPIVVAEDGMEFVLRPD